MNNLDSIKILVVDDEIDLEPLVRQKFRKQIRSGIYDFVFAFNGVEALKKIIEFPEIGIVLSDINMPEMDGLTLLTRLKELQNPALKTVIVSAYGDMENIRTAMNRGAFDFITKPVNFEDLEVTINKTLEEIQKIRKSLDEHRELISIQEDLNVAREIQQAILPKIFPPFPGVRQFDIYASMEAAKSVGGDFYDFFMIDENRLGFVIGDVSGKGVPAAIFMAVSRTLIRATGIQGVPAVDCIKSVNKLLCLESVSSMFVTVFYGILNISTGEVEYVNAGHNPPYIVTTSGICKVEMTDGIVLGVFDDFEYTSKSFVLNPGDYFLLFTDGVTEAFNNKEEMFGDDRLESLLSERSGESIVDVVKDTFEAVQKFSSGIPQSDDITILSLAYYGKE
jgi:phosphoserine phosphatase RsbU/P